jgi:hypothetical protein
MGASIWSFRHQLLPKAIRPSSRRQQSDNRLEDFPSCQLPLSQTSLHGRRPNFTSEFERTVRLDEIVVAAE